MISCLTVTREEKLADLKRAVECFHRQSVKDRELVIVHDGGESFDRCLAEIAAGYEHDEISVHRVTQRGQPLGALRNIAVARARGELVCQWDDDDLYHPNRLDVQRRALVDADTDFSFLTDQLHFFVPTGELFWDDWRVEAWPGSLIQGSILGKRDRMRPYSPLPRGEDTCMVRELLESGCRLTGVSDRGYLYIYVFNGNNAWDLHHHAAISAWKRKRKTYLEENELELRRQLSRYDLPWKEVVMPHETGSIVIK